MYHSKGPGQWWQLAIVDDSTLGFLNPGKVGIVDAADYWPWPTIGSSSHCYTVTIVSRTGLEGPMSAEVCHGP